ncbi:MAG TPA: HNH endonuclease [Mycobacteriales bacterium]|nr:HNH endonuclease [Mycobacteriales bacterium]
MPEALVLNATYEPLCVVSARRAAVLVLTDKAVSVQQSDEVLHAERLALTVPSVVRLSRFVKVPYRAAVPLTRKGVLARDGHRCVYCGDAATSLDHVVPRSRGGGHTWDNVVAACRRCNHQKADRPLHDLGWRIPRPVAPTGAAWRILGSRWMDPRWLPFLSEKEAAAPLLPATASA